MPSNRLSFTLASSFLFFSAAAEKINLPWCKPDPAEPYPPMIAMEGDTVVFDWLGEAHNVVIYPSGDCMDWSDKEFVSEAPGSSYTFGPEDVGTSKTFVCTISNHCMQGQIVTFDVVAAGTEDIAYLTTTPCGEGFLGEPPTEPPVEPEPEEPESAGDSVGAMAPLAGSVVAAGFALLT